MAGSGGRAYTFLPRTSTGGLVHEMVRWLMEVLA